MILTAESAFVDGAIRGPTVLGVHDDRITELRPWSPGDPPVHDGMFMPGLVNAHTHLELSWVRDLLPPGLGFDGWLESLLSFQRPSDTQVAEGIQELVACGTAAVSDICNGPETLDVLADAGLKGIVQRELFGLDRSRQADLLERAAEPCRERRGLLSRPSPHAVYSTPLPLLRACIQADGAGRPASIHVCESPEEVAFLEEGSGSFGPRFDALGLEWRWWSPPGMSAIAHLHAHGLLCDLLLVHGVHLREPDRAAIADSGCTVVLCPRSNLHIGGRLADVPALISANIPLALGTDSLASCADLDVLQEVGVLRHAFPEVPLATWLHAVTAGGADALGVDVGRLKVGAQPKVLRVHPERPWTEREVCVG